MKSSADICPWCTHYKFGLTKIAYSTLNNPILTRLQQRRVHNGVTVGCCCCYCSVLVVIVVGILWHVVGVATAYRTIKINLRSIAKFSPGQRGQSGQRRLGRVWHIKFHIYDPLRPNLCLCRERLSTSGFIKKNPLKQLESHLRLQSFTPLLSCRNWQKGLHYYR